MGALAFLGDEEGGKMKRWISIFIILIASQVLALGEMIIYEVGEEGAHIAWKPAPNPPKVPKGFEIGYCVYICESKPKVSKSYDKGKPKPVKKFVNHKPIPANEPIADTSCSIYITQTVKIFDVGVQTVVYDREKPEVCDPDKVDEYHSQIAWSDKKIYSNDHPFRVTYDEH